MLNYRRICDIACIAVCLVITSILFIYFGKDKRVVFGDEIYSYTITNSDKATYQFETGRIYSRNEVEDMLSHTEGDSILKMLKNVAKDKVHPPIYYIFMYISSVVLGGYSKWIGLSVNLLFLLGIVILIWKFIYQITGSRISAILSVCVYLLNTSTLSDMLLIRMYMAMTFFSMLLVYYESIIENEEKTKKFYPGLMLITASGFLTQYYFAFFAIAFFIVEFAFNLKKNRSRVKAYFLSLLAAVGVATVVWPLWIPSMVLNSHAGAIARSAVDFLHMFKRALEGFRILQVAIFQKAYVFGMFFIVVLSVAYFASSLIHIKRGKERKLVMKLLTAAFIYAVLVRILTPDYLTSGRYYYPAQMLEIISIIIMIYSLIAEYISRYKDIAFIVACIILIVGDYIGYRYGYGIDYYGDAVVYDEQMEILQKYSDGLWIMTDNHVYEFDAMMAFWCIPEYLVVLDQNTDESVKYSNGNEFEGVDETIIVSIEHMTDYGMTDNSDAGLYYIIGSTGRFATDELLFRNGSVLIYRAQLQ